MIPVANFLKVIWGAIRSRYCALY